MTVTTVPRAGHPRTGAVPGLADRGAATAVSRHRGIRASCRGRSSTGSPPTHGFPSSAPAAFPTDCRRRCVSRATSTKSAARRAISARRKQCFYRDLAAATGVRTLRSVYADIDPATQHGVVITEDVVSQGGTFLDGNSPYTPDQTAQTLAEFARLHAATWADPRYTDMQWLAPRLGRVLEVWGEATTIDIIGRNFDGPNGQGVPDEVRDAHRLVDAYRSLRQRRRGNVVRHPRRCPRRQSLSRCRRDSVPGRLATRPTRHVVLRRRLPHRLDTDRRGASTQRTRSVAALS